MSYTLSNTVTRHSESKALMISFMLHAGVIGFYLLFLHQKPFEMLPSKAVVLELSNIERMIQKPSPQKVVEEVKKVEPIKPIEQVKPKPIMKKEVVIPVPLKEEVSNTPIPVIDNVQPTLAQEVTPSLPPVMSDTYEKTDFEIIRDKVLARLIYPSVAKRMGLNGLVKIALVIDTDGRLVSVTIQSSSGKEILDNAALEAANKLQNEPLPKPKRLSTVILPIAFKFK